MFLRLQTQWNYAGMGVPIGLNYQSAESLFRIYKVKNPRKMLDELREIEMGALEAMAKSAKEQGSRES